MIEVRNLTKRYPGVVAVDGVCFDVEAGQTVGFLGPNGSGKTTTMRILATYLAPTAGYAKIDGFDVVRQSIQVRQRIGYLPESNPLYLEMRVFDYLCYRGRLRSMTRAEARVRAGEAIILCGVEDVRHRVIGHLSKGYRQRVGLADAILHRPSLVILDEPTIGLDPNQVQEMRLLIHRLGQERTVLLSTHILSEVEAMCRRIMIMSAGKLVAHGTIDAIAQQLGLTGRYRLVVAGDGRTVKGHLDDHDGVRRVFWNPKGALHEFEIVGDPHRDLRSSLYAAGRQAGWDLRELAQVRPSLEEIFAHVTAARAERPS